MAKNGLFGFSMCKITQIIPDRYVNIPDGDRVVLVELKGTYGNSPL